MKNKHVKKIMNIIYQFFKKRCLLKIALKKQVVRVLGSSEHLHLEKIYPNNGNIWKEQLITTKRTNQMC